MTTRRSQIWRQILCLCLTALLNIWGHITTVPACSSDTLTNVLPHRNVIPQTQYMTPHPVTVYRHGTDLSIFYQLMWNVTLECTTTHFNVSGQTRSLNPSPTFHTQRGTLNFMMLLLWLSVGSSVESVTYPPGYEPGTFGVRIHYAISSPTAASYGKHTHIYYIPVHIRVNSPVS